jgi:tetraacyldisaccharide 4'-kinase
MSIAFDLGTKLHNTLYDRQWLASKSYPLPVICVGNLAVGGTGKTPHTEYLIDLLQAEGLHVATLSRGYKRHTKGYLKATSNSSAQQIGDEPWQLKHNHAKLTVAVDEDRCHGIEQLMQEQPRVEAIILDDAYQHRAVRAGLYILLTDYHRLYSQDMVLPAGRLRENKQGAERAQIVVVTKCPNNLTEADFDNVRASLNLLPHQQLFFSTIVYSEPQPVFKQGKPWPTLIDDSYNLLAVTGIAHPESMMEYLHTLTPQVELMSYPDHHDFTPQDLQKMQERFALLPENKLVITTQKDAARLHGMASQLNDSFKSSIYALPIRIAFLRDQQDAFNRNILAYVNQDARQ